MRVSHICVAPIPQRWPDQLNQLQTQGIQAKCSKKRGTTSWDTEVVIFSENVKPYSRITYVWSYTSRFVFEWSIIFEWTFSVWIHCSQRNLGTIQTPKCPGTTIRRNIIRTTERALNLTRPGNLILVKVITRMIILKCQACINEKVPWAGNDFINLQFSDLSDKIFLSFIIQIVLIKF